MLQPAVLTATAANPDDQTRLFNVEEPRPTRPNIILILTDDQDVHMDSLRFTPLTHKHLISQGTLYKKHFCTTAVCCPSRASLWTGKLSHNTNVTDLTPPYGGYPIFVKNGHNENYLPIWLQSAGYSTYVVGKMFNAHTLWNYDSPHLKGWDGSAFGFLEDAVSAEKPFFLAIAPIAPHSNVNSSFITPVHGPDDNVPITDDGLRVPRNANFNPDKPSGADWIRRQPKLTDEQVEYNDGHYRGRLQSLQAVDELVDGLFERLETKGLLDNTYAAPGKECGYEEDINIPLIIRGPGIPKGQVSEAVTAHVDLAPTVLHLAGAPLRADFDGRPVPLSAKEIEEAPATREHVGIEYWGWALVFNNTYKAIRVIGEGYSLYYSVWCTNEHELYDMTNDPGQLVNLLHPDEAKVAESATVLGHSIKSLVPRLDALLFVLKSCSGISCSQPWRSLHPQGNVASLRDALSQRFDAFYAEQARVEWSRCELGHIIDAEGPQFEKDGNVYWQGSRWSDWT
ncbi:unnamed protein product [Parascedosporium putredinis]|uniref:Sulfatase N-terminal domain-containing protein n=1 Tax=Parascedosporium putredinis TaxID=1442378 RepID=A0A9P1GYL8_9PEZI|nr:unnamed protein product [Parascedosporium putredinis]CAI7990121.1 unnamed protein product [Parascedosporium putredinis]